MALLLMMFTAQTASNVASLFGGMLPGGKVSKEKFRALSVKDSKDTKNQSSDSALPMLPVLARLWCHEVSRTFTSMRTKSYNTLWTWMSIFMGIQFS